MTTSTVRIPDVIIAAPIGSLSKLPGFAAAKSGDAAAAVQVVQSVLTPTFLDSIRHLARCDALIQPVAAIESTGFNCIPVVAAVMIANELGLQVGDSIVQLNSPFRTRRSGLDRIFHPPQFYGTVEYGRNYVLVDDTVTQGRTFANLAVHVDAAGGHVVAAIALTGKQYSAKIALSPSTLGALRARYGDIEPVFSSIAGYGYDQLTESEARYLVTYKPAQWVRDEILSACRATDN
jgi:orotate phosphoribosyltransferase-like protein